MTFKNIYWGLIAISLVILSYSVHLFLNTQQISFVTKEDGVFETGTAILFLVSGILFLTLFFRVNETKNIFGTKRNVCCMILAAIFILGCLEEISWGQRIFNIETPEIFKNMNMKDEINLHNLEVFHRADHEGIKSGWALMLNTDRMFSLFWFSYCCILPVIYYFDRRFKRLVEKFNLPVPPLFIGPIFILNYMISKLMFAKMDTSLRSIIEIKEFNFAILFFIISLWLLIKSYKQKAYLYPAR